MQLFDAGRSPMLAVERNGCILHTEKYEACIRFYRDTVGLRIEFEKNEPGQILTIFDFGGAYLMVEPGGVARKEPKNAYENPVTIRLNVPDVDEAAETLRTKGIDVAVSRFDWGAIGDFCDPDGNRCQLREVASFAR